MTSPTLKFEIGVYINFSIFISTHFSKHFLSSLLFKQLHYLPSSGTFAKINKIKTLHSILLPRLLCWEVYCCATVLVLNSFKINLYIILMVNTYLGRNKNKLQTSTFKTGTLITYMLFFILVPKLNVSRNLWLNILK